MSYLKLLIISFLVFFSASDARAEIFLWQDPDTHVSMTTPDTWRRGINQKPDDVLTILAPGQNDQAACRLRVREDRRFLIHPRHMDDEIQRLHYSRDFWEYYLGEYDDVVFYRVTDNAGLAEGFASYAEASYTTTAGPRLTKHAIIFAALYGDKAYILECSAAFDAFPYWHRTFNSVLKSVDFAPYYHSDLHGHYRNFMGDKPIRINGQRPQDVYYNVGTVPPTQWEKIKKWVYWDEIKAFLWTITHNPF